MFRRVLLFVPLIVLTLAPALALAQGGGASTTGAINGKVSDNTGAVLPGVSVTISSPSMMGTQTTNTNDQGIYRFAAVPSGTYKIVFEMPGFATLSREGIVVTLGFTATVNVDLALASVQETVTVTGESPVVDVASTRIQQNFNLEQLEALPNARDMWALLAESPGVAMTRFDVGGNRAGTQTGYTAYGFGGQGQQVRVLVEGINTTEGTGGAGFYFDYGSFEEVFLGTAAQGAEMPHPGVQSQFIGKSGGNNFQGQVYLDYENNSLQGSNITDEQIARGVREGSNEINDYRDFNVNLGGPIAKDRLWWYFSYRDQYNGVFQSNFLFDQDFTTLLQNVSGKGTFQLNQKNKVIGYLQFGRKYQPYRTATNAFSYPSPDYTRSQDSWSWVWKGEWNWLASDQTYLEFRYGNFGYFFPLEGYSSEPRREDNGTRIITGGDWQWQQDRNRNQGTGAVTYFKDNWGGSHNFKFGGEINDERQKNGITEYYPGNVRHIFQNGRSIQVYLGAPTADGSLDNLLSIAKLRHIAAFLMDSWSVGNRLTLNLGIRYDNYKSHIPEQKQLAYSFGPLNVPAATIPAQTFFTWNSVAPRVGATIDLAGDNKTVLKLNYGYFGHNPGPGIAASANPNQNQKFVQYEWNDLNGDRLYQPGEEGAVIQTNLAGTISVDPDISQPYTHEVNVFVEREIAADFGIRVGYVYKTTDNDWQTYRPFRPIDAHTVPFTFADIGADGRAGTSDDAVLTFLGLPRAQLSQFPPTNVIQNVDTIGRYKTIEVALNKRFSNRWSMVAGFGYTWTREHNTGYGENTVSPSYFPNSPNDTSLHEFTGWGFKTHGTYDAPYGIRISPIFRYQSGVPYGRTATVTASAASGAFYSGTILLEPVGTRRMPSINILDVRVEKIVNISRTKLRLFLDVFNILNSSAPERISFQTGSAFEAPQIILAPRVMRVGFRFDW
jgi:hypothetical protein